MPKNTINLHDGASVTVGWSKEYPEAQVGVVWKDGMALFADFSERSQINGLIRALRQARDGAFGRDE